MTILESIYNNYKNIPNEKAVTAFDGTVTYKQLWEYVQAFATYIEKYGLSQGDRVIIHNKQNVGFVIMQLGLLLYGLAVCPVSENATESDIEKTKKEIMAKRLFLDNEYDISLNGMQTLLKNTNIKNYTLPEENMEADVLYTTGTTGNPEGIIHTHKSHFATIENIIGILEINNVNNLLITTPLHHSFALRRLYANLVLGYHTIILYKLMPLTDFFLYLKKYSITSIVTNSSAMSIILHYGMKTLGEYADKIQYIEFSTSPLKKDIIEKLINILPHTHLYNTYGSSEAATTLCLDMAKYSSKIGCVGKPTRHTKILILDKNGNEINGYGIENKGYLAVVGKSIMKGYVKEESNKKFNPNLYISKDIAYKDEEGFYYIVGRDDDIITTGGYKIAPEEVEDIASKYAGIEECACVGKPDKTAGQVPVLFITTNEQYNENDFYKFLSSNIETYKYPKEIRIIDEIPKTFNGKILRRQLRGIL